MLWVRATLGKKDAGQRGSQARAMEDGIRLELPDGRPPLKAVADINEALAETGTGVWPLALGDRKSVV